MRIGPSERVVYENNPLAEVVCQVRFTRAQTEDKLISLLSKALMELGYPSRSIEEITEISIQLTAGGQVQKAQDAPPRIYHFSSEDQIWKASVSAEFLALTCSKYQSWSEFKPRMLKLSSTVVDLLGPLSVNRIGLRYKDLIERESIGLAGVPWNKLIAPFLMGPLANNGLFDDGPPADADVSTYVFQLNINLDDCKLLLQGGLLSSVDGNRRAFLVDSDFFCDDESATEDLAHISKLDSTLEALHANAGALFSKTILGTLHHALKPISSV